MSPNPALSIIIPAHNEERRLPFTLAQLRSLVTERSIDCEVIVVDNGSVDSTWAVVESLRPRFPQLRLIRTDRAGKGLAVRTGALASRGRVVLFADADRSWDLEGIVRFPSLVAAGFPIVIGTRVAQGSGTYEPGLRHLMSRVFNAVAQAIAVPGIRDTQCGFKAFRADVARALFSRQTIDGFGFDVELLVLASRLGYRVRQEPLRWAHDPHSSVSPVRDALRMLRDVLTIQLNTLGGRYIQESWSPASDLEPVLPARAA